jgi:hypothetical protein
MKMKPSTSVTFKKGTVEGLFNEKEKEMKMEKVTYRRDDEGDYDIIIAGENCGSVGRGWLRLGGNQWVLNSAKFNASNRGFSSLAECKLWIVDRCKQILA